MKQLSSPIELIKRSINLFSKKENFLYLVKIYSPLAILSLLSVAISFLPSSFRAQYSAWLIGGSAVIQILNLLVSTFVAASGIMALGKIVGGKNLSVRATFESARKRYWVFLLLSILTVLIVAGGFILLIIPGILFSVWFAFSRLAMIDANLGVKESLVKSRELVKGRFWRVFGRLIIIGIFTALVQFILGVTPYGVGLILVALAGGLLLAPTYLLYKELNE
jgi:hypothetical protein